MIWVYHHFRKHPNLFMEISQPSTPPCLQCRKTMSIPHLNPQVFNGFFSSVKSWNAHSLDMNTLRLPIKTQMTEPNLKFSSKKRDFNHLQISNKHKMSAPNAANLIFWWKNLEFEEHVPAITTFLVAARPLFTPRNTNSIRKAAVSIAWKAYKWCSSGPSSIVIQLPTQTMHQEIPRFFTIHSHGLIPPNWRKSNDPCHDDSNIPKNHKKSAYRKSLYSLPFFSSQESASIRQAVALRKDVSAMCSGLGKGPSKAWRASLRKNQLPNLWLIH